MTETHTGLFGERRFSVFALALVLAAGLTAGFWVESWRGDRAAAEPQQEGEAPPAALPPGVVNVPEAAQENAGM